MPHALLLGLVALFDRRLFPLWLKSLVVTLILCAGIGVGGWWGLSWVIERYVSGHALGEFAAALAMVFALWLLWRVVALAVMHFFADSVMLAIEQRSYPDRALTARSLAWHEELRRGLGGALRALVFNLLALPVAAALVVTGFGPALVMLGVNAVLLGRELQDMVWMRHRASAADPSPLSRLERWALGGVVATLLTVPIANLAAPFLGAACAVHLVHRKSLRHAH